MHEQEGSRAIGTFGGKCGCAAATAFCLAALPILGLFFMGDCFSEEQCRSGNRLDQLAAPLAMAAVATIVGLTVRILVNRFLAWNSRPRTATAGEVAEILRKCRDGTATHREIDRFISIAIADPALDAVREEVAMLHGPGWYDETTRARLAALLQRVEALAQQAS